MPSRRTRTGRTRRRNPSKKWVRKTVSKSMTVVRYEDQETTQDLKTFFSKLETQNGERQIS